MKDVQRAADDEIYGVDRGGLAETGPSVGSMNGVVASLAVTGAPGSVQGLQLVVTDMDAAVAELRGRGVELSDVEELGAPGRQSFELAHFGDPDGNRWVVQEIPA